MATQAKIYDFPFAQIQEQVRSILNRSPGHEASVGDLISKTGLPKHQVETVLPAVVEDCRGQMKVTESGDILYYFPKGLSSQSRGWKVWSRQASAFLARVGKFAFKAWIMVMLIGYFALFVALVVLAVLASFAAKTASKDSNSRGGDLLGGRLMMRILDLMLTFWIWREPRDRGWNNDGQQRKRTNNRAFYKSVFAFVFGEENLATLWDEKEKKAVISFIQSKKGIVTQEEIMALTGKDREKASGYLSRLLLEFEGEPMVSEEGTLYYSFKELLKTSHGTGETAQLPPRPALPFNANAKKTNVWIGFFNSFNLAFGAYFFTFGLLGAARRGFSSFYYLTNSVLLQIFSVSPADANATLLWGLGAVPLVFSLGFFLIPFLRRLKEKAVNREIEKGNLRRGLLEKALETPLDLRLTPVEEKLLPEVLGASDVQVVAAGSGFSYQLKDLARQAQDLKTLRSRVNLQDSRPGKVIFDSGV